MNHCFYSNPSCHQPSFCLFGCSPPVHPLGSQPYRRFFQGPGHYLILLPNPTTTSFLASTASSVMYTTLWGGLSVLFFNKVWLRSQLPRRCVGYIHIISPDLPLFPLHPLAPCNQKLKALKLQWLQPTFKHIQQPLNICKVLSSISSISWAVKSGCFVMIWNWNQTGWLTGI